MELANIPLHIENTSKRSILGSRWRKCNMKEKLNNLHNENRGKRVILWKFLNDGQKHNGYNPAHTVRVDSCNSAGDCESMSCESYSMNEYESRTTLNQAHLFDDKYSYDSLSSSDSSSASSDWLTSGLCREVGDGTETPDIPRCISNRGTRKMFQRKVTSTDEPGHIDAYSRKGYLNREYSCTLRLFAKPEETSTSSASGRCVTSPVITKSTRLHANDGHVSSTYVDDKDCLNVETSQHVQCHAFTLTKARLRHNAKSKLKQLMKLYKARKSNRKSRSTKHVKALGNGNVLNSNGIYRLTHEKLASSCGASQNAEHDDMCQTVELDNRDGRCALERNTIHQSKEKKNIVSNRLADFYDSNGLDLAMDCYCLETDDLTNGFMME